MANSPPCSNSLDLAQRASVVIGGDTLEHRKPHPLPLQVAAERLQVDCSNCVYVGDDERDIVAARAAGMKSLVAAYGYIKDGTSIDAWNADGLIDQPDDLLRHPLLAIR